tara:strand:+ start:232 stop:696 length:465 start_codon:yes stop_codon:yes gene_type:complete
MTNYDWLLEQLKIDTDDCQEWAHYRHPQGYGRVKVNGKYKPAHRVALQLATGQTGEGREATHIPIVCHNRACFNPRHLEWKSHAENMADTKIDGTSTTGETNARSKLTEPTVRRIMALWESGSFLKKELAEMFDISAAHTGRIVTKKNWSHLWN